MVNKTYTTDLSVVDLTPQATAAPPATAPKPMFFRKSITRPYSSPGKKNTVILWGRSADGIHAACRLWDLNGTPKRLALGLVPNTVSSLALSPDGNTLAVAGSDGLLGLWDAATLVERSPKSGHRGAVQFLAFADGDRTVISGSRIDNTVRVWDHSQGKERHCINLSTADGGPLNPTYGVNFTCGADGSGLLAWNHQGVRGLDVIANKHRNFSAAAEGGLQGLAVSPDGKTLATVSGGKIKLWDAITGAARPTVLPNITIIGVMSFSHDGKLLAVPCQIKENGRYIQSGG